jgi:hypothetical protein
MSCRGFGAAVFRICVAFAAPLLFSACRAVAPNACEVGPYCDGETAHQCSYADSDGEDWGRDCSRFGDICVERGKEANCALPWQEPCTASDGDRCRGTWVDVCNQDIDMWWGVVDCAPRGCITTLNGSQCQ